MELEITDVIKAYLERGLCYFMGRGFPGWIQELMKAPCRLLNISRRFNASKRSSSQPEEIAYRIGYITKEVYELAQPLKKTNTTIFAPFDWRSLMTEQFFEKELAARKD